MPAYTDLDIRMKQYEKVTDQKLIRRMPVIIRLDGRSFHSFTRGFKKPFDDILIDSMQKTALYLCENVQNCALAYTQSDEISLLLIDYEKFDTQPWFDNRIQKIVSTSAALVTMKFKEIFLDNIDQLGRNNIPDWDQGGTYEQLNKEQEEILSNIDHLSNAIDKKYKGFDSRCFNLSKDEVSNYFFWRQQDCVRNSVQMVAQANFSQAELQNKNTATIKEMLLEKNIDWESDFRISRQRGTCCIKAEDDNGCRYWYVDNHIPVFRNEGRDYINNLVYVGE